MWKYIARGLRAPFEKGPWSNLTSTAATEQSRGNLSSTEKKSQLPCPFRFVPCLLETCQRHLSQFSIQNNYSDEQRDDKHNKSSDKNKAGESFHSESVNFQPCAILGAFGWSGVLVLGWTIVQPWYRHKEQRKRLTGSEVNRDSVDKRYSCLYKLLLNPALSQPVNNHVLPPRIAPKELRPPATPPSTPASSPTLSESSSKTIEEAFDEAAEEVRKVHESAIGEAENRLGVACLSHQKNDKAVEHFRNALALNHAPAAFNLGQCHELGIGTTQDFVQAAQYYQIASDMGHPTATYNLGVFYAHGWGGLMADIRKAKNLFLTAAELGQPEARHALGLETKHQMEINRTGKQTTDSFESRLAFNFWKKDNISLHFTSKTANSDDSKQFSDIPLGYSRPESSLPSSPTSSIASFSPPASSSPSSLDDHPLMFHQNISTVEEEYSDVSSEDEWQNAIDLATVNGNSATLFRLAVCYENSPTADPELILQLYRMAADHGHREAKLHLKILEEYYALGILDDYLKSNKQKSKNSSFGGCGLQK